MIFAVTLTASPHKDKFKKLSWEKQKEKFKAFFERFKQLFHDLRYIFEICPTSNMVHVHLCVQPIEDHAILSSKDIMDTVFHQYFIYEFGYFANPEEHFVLSKPIRHTIDYDIWEDYMYKTVTSICMFPKS